MTAITTPHGSAHDGIPALLARYRSLLDARAAIRNLEGKGVDGDDLALVGAAARAEKNTRRSTLDRRILGSATLSLAVGIVCGGIVGAVIGAIGMLIVLLAWPNVASGGTVFILMVCWFTAAGALFGSIGSIMRTLGFSESLPLTWEDETGEPVWLAVYGEHDRAVEVVATTFPVEMVDDPVVTAHPDELAAVR
jgi:hypothetical protein